MIIQLKNVTKKFGELIAINNLSFEVNKGDIFGVAGPNGAGKTTLFNIITGILHGSGEIIFEGTNISHFGPHQICQKGIARTFQIPCLFKSMTTFENILVGAQFGLHAERKRKETLIDIINEVIDYVGLKEKQNINADNLSLYDKKLTMFAAALATKPRLLLLDEPMGGLSPIEILQISNLISKINNELKVTIIIIEHLVKTLLELSNQMMILHFGEKICVGSPNQVFKDGNVREIYLGANLRA